MPGGFGVVAPPGRGGPAERAVGELLDGPPGLLQLSRWSCRHFGPCPHWYIQPLNWVLFRVLRTVRCPFLPARALPIETVPGKFCVAALTSRQPRTLPPDRGHIYQKYRMLRSNFANWLTFHNEIQDSVLHIELQVRWTRMDDSELDSTEPLGTVSSAAAPDENFHHESAGGAPGRCSSGGRRAPWSVAGADGAGQQGDEVLGVGAAPAGDQVPAASRVVAGDDGAVPEH